MEIEIPTGAAYILQQLNKHGYEAYIVGGCVRDSLLGKQPNDWDITTSAKPEEVKAIFHRTIDTGIQHGTVTVLVDREILDDGSGSPASHTDYAFEFYHVKKQVTGIEPAYPAWEAGVLPMNYTCIDSIIVQWRWKVKRRKI